MFFLRLLKPPQLHPRLIYGCPKQDLTLLHMLLITSIKKWQPCHTTMGLFEVHETMGFAMAMQLKYLLARYELLDKVLSYVKDEGVNLSTFIMALTNIISCAPLMLPQPYATIYYGHAMSKFINMLQMISRCVMERERFQLKLLNRLYRKQLPGPRKMGGPSKSEG
jgi:hypothetical protein